MTDQELADAIRERYDGRGSSAIDIGAMLAGLRVLLENNPPVVPDPPCTIDKVPGWTVHVDATGEMFAMNSYGVSYFRESCRRGVDSEGVLHPWPDPPLYQPGDLQELADAISGIIAGVGSIFTEAEAIHAIETLPEIQAAFERLCCSSPSMNEAQADALEPRPGPETLPRIAAMSIVIDLTASGSSSVLHPWPDPPPYQPGDLVDVDAERVRPHVDGCE